MLAALRILAVSLVFLPGIPRLSTAQGVDIPAPSEILAQFQIDEITEESSKVTVRARRVEANGRLTPGLVIRCHRSPSDRSMLTITDVDQQTDDRIYVDTGFCDALLAAARRRKETQKP